MMRSIGETDIQVEMYIVGKVRALHIAALDALRPRLGLSLGIDLNPVEHALPNGQPISGEYRLTDLRGDLRLGEKGPSIGFLHRVGGSREVRPFSYSAESQIQLACDLDPWTLERIEAERDGGDLALGVELWPRLEHPSGYLPGSIQPFRLAVPREDWLRFLEGVGFGTYEILELRIPDAESDSAHRAIDGLREAQRLLWAGNQAGALTECRKAIEALESLAPGKKLGERLDGLIHPDRAKEYSSIASKLKAIASAAVHDYGRDATFSRSEVLFLIRTTASLAQVVLSATPPEGG